LADADDAGLQTWGVVHPGQHTVLPVLGDGAINELDSVIDLGVDLREEELRVGHVVHGPGVEYPRP
jgi:hypothetical protein